MNSTFLYLSDAHDSCWCDRCFNCLHLSAIWPVDESQSEMCSDPSVRSHKHILKENLKSTVSHFCCELSLNHSSENKNCSLM